MELRDGRPQALLEWSVAARPLPGQASSGDRATVVFLPEGALVAAVDGLGHGPHAARAAETAVEVLQKSAHEGLVSAIQRCHEALKSTRGVALSAAAFWPLDGTMTWLGVGNIEGRLVRAAELQRGSGDLLVPPGGLAGHSMPPLRPITLSVQRGDLLIFATDGIERGFADSLNPAGATHEIAGRVLENHARATDDALVVVTRYAGGTP